MGTLINLNENAEFKKTKERKKIHNKTVDASEAVFFFVCLFFHCTKQHLRSGLGTRMKFKKYFF